MLTRFTVLAFCFLATVNSAQAHFLFVRVLPPAEGGRFAEVYFSEQAQAGDPRFVDKIASTQLWLQSSTGEAQPLTVHKTNDRLRALLPNSASGVVVGSCTYGVLTRGKTSFLLRHFPKSLVGDADALKAAKPFAKVPLEIVALPTGDGLKLTALLDGKPMPNVELTTIDRTLGGIKLKTDADGQATWKPSKPGYYSVYVSHFHKTAGQHGDKKYEEIRDFATLSLPWPLTPSADPAATALFEEALKARASWRGFPGFAAKIAGQVDGRSFKGDVTIDAAGTVTLDIGDEPVQPWIEETLSSLAMHRGAGSSSGPSKVRYAFADDDGTHPLGRLLLVEGGRFASSYRVKDKQILVVNRLMGKQNMTIVVQENDRNKEGQFLPRGYAVQYWDAATGSLRQVDAIHERWTRIGSWDLPAEHVETRSSGAGLTVRSYALTGHELHKAKGAR